MIVLVLVLGNFIILQVYYRKFLLEILGMLKSLKNMQLTIQIFCKVYVVIDILKPLENYLLKFHLRL